MISEVECYNGTYIIQDANKLGLWIFSEPITYLTINTFKLDNRNKSVGFSRKPS